MVAPAPLDIPIARVDDIESMLTLIEALRRLHGSDYDFAIGRWAGRTRFEPRPGRAGYRFIIAANRGAVALRPGDLVRGPTPGGPYHDLTGDGSQAEVTGTRVEALWPGDVIALAGDAQEALVLEGRGAYFEVTSEQTTYRAPKLTMLRHLTDKPGGCAAYPGAFRREALPPLRPAPHAADQRGPNRVNEHTLDMRIDRRPGPISHYHGPVSRGDGQTVNHSETAIVLSRSLYGLPEVDIPDSGHLVIYRRPAEDPADKVIIPVRPGSIVVTPATTGQVMGHRFENAFAMLLAIPGFVAPYHLIEAQGEQHLP